jgi:hypothetical protein
METAYIVTGTLTDDHTVTLDESLPMAQGKVRLCLYLRQSVLTQKSSQRFVNANAHVATNHAHAKKLTLTFKRNVIAGMTDALLP